MYAGNIKHFDEVLLIGNLTNPSQMKVMEPEFLEMTMNQFITFSLLQTDLWHLIYRELCFSKLFQKIDHWEN